jgi:protein-S-isoprenylcysteine O-methyltransferase Ste14
VERRLLAKALLVFPAALVVVACALFIPAGTLDYWQAWLFMGCVFVPAAFVTAYFLKNDPAFLQRRLKHREGLARQRRLIGASQLVFAIGFIVPGLDRRFGWSGVPPEVAVAANAVVLLSYAAIFLVFRENSFAGRVVEVYKRQKVISTGPYAFVRHPMYLAVLFMYLSAPIALGSYWGVLPMLLLVPVIVLRLLDEERLLRQKLSGYEAYCRKTRYRLVPLVW